MSNEHLPCPLERAKNPFTCGISGRTFTALEQKERVDILKRQLKKEMGWEVNQGSEWDKVVGIYAFNTVSDELILYKRAREIPTKRSRVSGEDFGHEK